MNKQELQAEIGRVKGEIDNFELDNDDYVDTYNDSLNEAHGEFMGYQADYILKQVDPVAYYTGLNAYVDGIDKRGDMFYRGLEEELQELEDELEALEDQE